MRGAKLALAFVLMALLASVGFGAGRAEGSSIVMEASLSPEAQERILDLAIRWLYEADESLYLETEEKIRMLSVEEARLFLTLSLTIQHLGFPEDAPNMYIVPPTRQRHLLDLTRQALYRGESVEGEINALSSEERALFRDFVTAIQEITAGQGASCLSELELLSIETKLTLMEENEMSLLDLSEDQFMDALREEVSRICESQPPAWAAADGLCGE
jgi:hypothetical protein